MIIQNILIVSPMYKEIKKHMESFGLEKNFLFLHEDEVSGEHLTWADAFVAFNTQQDYDYSQVKWVHSLGAGVDRFLFKKKWKEEVLLTRTICSFGQRIAEYSLSYILKDLQYHDSFQELKKQKKWEPLTPKLLGDQKVLIYGTGEIGQKTAKILSSFGVEVYGVSLSGNQKDSFKKVYPVDGHFNYLEGMNYVINTLPLTEKTEKLFNHRIFDQLHNAVFMNVGRGASINEESLLAALNNGHIRIAVLDVFENEPLPETNPLWIHPAIVITPHISAVTTPKEAVDCFVDTLRNIEEGKSLSNKVDIKKGF